MFALMAFTVVQKRREIGIRIATGATRQRVLQELVTQQMKPLAGGMIRGAILGAILVTVDSRGVRNSAVA